MRIKPAPAGRPAVFLDRDGTLLRERGYLSDPHRLRFYSDAFKALRLLRAAKLPIIILTNQSGIGRGFFSVATLSRIHSNLKRKLRAKGISIAGIYFCPHLPGAGCRCRKPNPGMPRRAARELGITLRSSYVIGDQARDVELARRIRARGVLVLTGAGKESRKSARGAAFVAPRLLSAARWVVADVQRRPA